MIAYSTSHFGTRLGFLGRSHLLRNPRAYFARRHLAYEVEGIRGHHYWGWAFRRDAPARRLWVSVELDGQSLGIVRADIYRADVQRAPFAHDGYCGFAFPIDWVAPHGARIVVLEPRCVIAARRPPVRRGADRPTTADGLVFHLDEGRERLSGWVSSAVDPHERIRLQVRSGTRVLAEQSACLYRSDAAVMTGDPFHGSSILLPPGPGAIDIREARTDRLLHRTGR